MGHHGPDAENEKIHHATLEPRTHQKSQVVTTGATTRSLIGVAILTERGTTWSATQVGLRPVESGLRGHERSFSVLMTGSNPHHIRYGNR